MSSVIGRIFRANCNRGKIGAYDVKLDIHLTNDNRGSIPSYVDCPDGFVKSYKLKKEYEDGIALGMPKPANLELELNLDILKAYNDTVLNYLISKLWLQDVYGGSNLELDLSATNIFRLYLVDGNNVEYDLIVANQDLRKERTLSGDSAIVKLKATCIMHQALTNSSLSSVQYLSHDSSDNAHDGVYYTGDIYEQQGFNSGGNGKVIRPSMNQHDIKLLTLSKLFSRLRTPITEALEHIHPMHSNGITTYSRFTNTPFISAKFKKPPVPTNGTTISYSESDCTDLDIDEVYIIAYVKNSVGTGLLGWTSDYRFTEKFERIIDYIKDVSAGNLSKVTIKYDGIYKLVFNNIFANYDSAGVVIPNPDLPQIAVDGDIKVGGHYYNSTAINFKLLPSYKEKENNSSKTVEYLGNTSVNDASLELPRLHHNKYSIPTRRWNTLADYTDVITAPYSINPYLLYCKSALINSPVLASNGAVGIAPFMQFTDNGTDWLSQYNDVEFINRFDGSPHLQNSGRAIRNDKAVGVDFAVSRAITSILSNENSFICKFTTLSKMDLGDVFNIPNISEFVSSKLGLSSELVSGLTGVAVVTKLELSNGNRAFQGELFIK